MDEGGGGELMATANVSGNQETTATAGRAADPVPQQARPGLARRLAHRVLGAALIVTAVVLAPVTAAAAATPSAASAPAEDGGRDASDLTIGVIIVVAIAVGLFFLYRTIRRRVRG